MPSLERDVVERLEGLAQRGDIDVRALALASLHLARGRDRGVRRLLGGQLAALGDRDDAVRRRWVVALGFVGDRYRERGEPRNAITVYGKALEIRPGDPSVLLQLGLASADAGDWAAAVTAYRMSDAAVLGDGRQAWIALRRGLEFDPANTAARQVLERLERALSHAH